jgi:hypothetical protein
MRVKRGIGVVLAACLLCTVGCSKSKSNDAAPTTAAPATTTTGGAPATTTTTIDVKAAFLKNGNAICATMNNKQKALDAHYPNGPQTPSQLVSYVTQVSGYMEDSLKGLKALQQPPGDAATLAAMYADVQQLIDLAHQLVAAASAGQMSKAEQLANQIDSFTTTTNTKFNSYGLTVCGEG